MIEPFPADFLHLLRALPRDDERPERPLKKLRLEAPETETLFVGRGALTISRDQPHLNVVDNRSFSRSHIGEYVTLSLSSSPQNSDEAAVSIVSRSGSPVNPLSVTIALPSGVLTAEASAIINAAGNDGLKRCQEAGLTSVFDVEVSHHEGRIDIHLSFELYWESRTHYHSPLGHQSYQTIRTVLDTFFPLDGKSAHDSAEWSPLDFYEAAYTPPKEDNTLESVDIPGMTSTLYPFQKRTLKWLLRREGVEWSKENPGSPSRLKRLGEESPDRLPLSFRRVRDLNGRECYLSDVFHLIATDLTHFRASEQFLKGGILAEEMGLGKTLEMIGLILLHPRPEQNPELNFDDPHAINPTGATLVVTPESLRRQWMDELSRHAPHLKIMNYAGCKVRDREEELSLVYELAEQDIVITTYSVLATELNYVLEPPARSRRHERKYYRTKSPLMQLLWWRVCLDEAQMIESGVSRAAEVAKLVPRVHAWGITGTPVKNAVQDLRGLLIFLRYEPFNFLTESWKDLTTRHKAVFRQLFHALALRHTKAAVRDEIKLPRQNRYVITVPFAAVEEQHYQSMFKEMTEDCDLDAQGTPVVMNWKPENYHDRMGTWLNRLRQAALHPEVLIRRLYGGTRNRPMRTVDEVLDAMIEQNERTIITEQRGYLMSRLTRGQLLENGPRVKEALAIWEKVRGEVAPIVDDFQKKLDNAIREASGGRVWAEGADGYELENETYSQEHQAGIAELRRKLRSILEVQHRAVFFCANAYFQIKENKDFTEPDSEEFKRLQGLEDEAYETAKTIRRKILAESYRKTEALRNRLSSRASEQSFTTIPELVVKKERGLESRSLIGQLEELYEILNQQADQLDEWREQVIQILLEPLVDEDEEGVERTGEEFADSTKLQDKLLAYVSVLRAAVADRQDAITGQINERVRHEMQMETANALDGTTSYGPLFLELKATRDRLKPDQAVSSMRGIISGLRQIKNRYFKEDANAGERQNLEAQVVNLHMLAIQKDMMAQTKAATAMESELELFTTTMNARVEYYRQLQAVSDSVLPYENGKDDRTMQGMQAAEDKLQQRLAAAESKHRYLVNLKETGSKSSEPRICVICQTPFVAGVLTICGHQFCKECMMLWFRAHRNCPVCKQHLKPSNLHDIVLKPQQLRIHAEAIDEGSSGGTEGNSAPGSSKHVQPSQSVIYTGFSPDKLEAIRNIDLDGPSFTTKVDNLVRHLLWLRQSDPGSKSIIYSSFSYFLLILENAFKRYRIGYTSITKPNGIKTFKEDPSIEVFILYARSHSSGLNLVNANHVFLCEPLLNTALELQAIARIDRIGQQHETTVWLYVIDGTVEESIYNLSVKRRIEHIGRMGKGKSQETTAAEFDMANALEMEQAPQLSRLIRKDGIGGEVVDKRDVWQCLFGQNLEPPQAGVPTEGGWSSISSEAV
ncbi:hypothetical protein jhhlp_002485 [Lomentospora prolificans]|uniref:RING-type domain-containing protein n=1 Tax=Lomentospora prolificans TaxID=41688 RepID=A0A2N3NE66_9PEZI|nr:hypothetical protein jhhlp_002485 [Lomentospora prolificans]